MAIKKHGKRESERIVYSSICVLDGRSEKFPCKLENISDSGGLISMSGPIPETLQKGDVINLKTILLSPVELQCKVIRIDDAQIAVQFLDK